MDKYFAIASGAVLGAFCRYWAGLWVAARLGTNFTYSTLVINLIGSFILGLFLAMRLDRGLFTPNASFFVATGWCASFTTYSTFSWETFRFIQTGEFKLAGINLASTVLGCLTGTSLGVLVARIL